MNPEQDTMVDSLETRAAEHAANQEAHDDHADPEIEHIAVSCPNCQTRFSIYYASEAQTAACPKCRWNGYVADWFGRTVTQEADEILEAIAAQHTDEPEPADVSPAPAPYRYSDIASALQAAGWVQTYHGTPTFDLVWIEPYSGSRPEHIKITLSGGHPSGEGHGPTGAKITRYRMEGRYDRNEVYTVVEIEEGPDLGCRQIREVWPAICAWLERGYMDTPEEYDF